jgi:hypothetical protein
VFGIASSTLEGELRALCDLADGIGRGRVEQVEARLVFGNEDRAQVPDRCPTSSQLLGREAGAVGARSGGLAISPREIELDQEVGHLSTLRPFRPAGNPGNP